MASISYEEIFSDFLGSITDYDLQENLSISDSEELMTEYLHKAVADSYVSHLFSSKKFHDEIHVFDYEMLRPKEDEDEDREFVIHAIAKWMVYEWLHNQVKSVSLTRQFFGGKEQSWFSQSAHLSQLRGLHDDAYVEARRFIQDRNYIDNSYLGGESL